MRICNTPNKKNAHFVSSTFAWPLHFVTPLCFNKMKLQPATMVPVPKLCCTTKQFSQASFDCQITIVHKNARAWPDDPQYKCAEIGIQTLPVWGTMQWSSTSTPNFVRWVAFLYWSHWHLYIAAGYFLKPSWPTWLFAQLYKWILHGQTNHFCRPADS